jgi:Kef-type K+ transport system membrane component KefB/Trk K+ transport system NAD-binding subunit
MSIGTDYIILLLTFGIVALASEKIGAFFARARLPLITGFLACGVVVGPFVLGLLPSDTPQKMKFLDQLCLVYIAFAAGNELRLNELRSRIRSIAWITFGLVVTTFTLGSISVFLLSSHIPFMKELSTAGRIAVAILAGTILVARSPSSAIAVIAEMRAKGRFTQVALSVTIVMDVVVITLFSICSSVAGSLFVGASMSFGFILALLFNLGASGLLGGVLGKVLQGILRSRWQPAVKTTLILLGGFGVFLLSSWLRSQGHQKFGFEVHLEPLLVCMIAGFLVANYTKCRAEFGRLLGDVGPTIFIVFFTLTGACLDLKVLATTWGIAVILFFVRLLGIFIGSSGGGMLAGDPWRHSRVNWMAFVTQAGVGLGLAKAAAEMFPQAGLPFATIMTAVIVLNQILGPPLFKWVITLVGESHRKQDERSFDGEHDAVIFGLRDQSIMLAKELQLEGWKVTVASRRAEARDELSVETDGVHILPINGISLEDLKPLQLEKVEAVVLMLSDEENYAVAEMAYEKFGTNDVVVHLNDRANYERFQELGAHIIDPSTAVVELMENFVTSPDAASLLMGMDEGLDVIGVEVQDPDLDGLAVRDLRLPPGVHVLSLRRRGEVILCSGYTHIALGDYVTVAGPIDSLEKLKLYFYADRDRAPQAAKDRDLDPRRHEDDPGAA